MACVAEFECKVCGQVRHEVVPRDYVCADCRTKTNDQKRRMHFASLTGLTVEERLARIEVQLYDLQVERRLKALEAKTATC